MKISVYMETIAYKYGGAEAYTASLIESLQEIYPKAEIALITEHLLLTKAPSLAEVVEMQNKAYGTDIKESNLTLSYFDFKKIEENKAKTSVSRIVKIILKEIYAVSRFNKILCLSAGSDLFINSSFNIVAGRGKKNICIVHFPKAHATETGINKRISFFKKRAESRDAAYQGSYDLYCPNSSYTAGYLKSYWNIPEAKVHVLYPPVRLINAKSHKNNTQILLCSRITGAKKIDVLVKAFESSDFLRNNARLVVAGSAIGEDSGFLESVQRMSSCVSFVLDPTREELESLYSSSGVFWHAMGFGETDPRKSEHFGITTVEAMSAGCIPVVIDKGGQKEIVTENCGFRWNSLEELVERTEWLIKNPEKADSLRANCIERSRIFALPAFKEGLKASLSEVLCA